MRDRIIWGVVGLICGMAGALALQTLTTGKRAEIKLLRTRLTAQEAEAADLRKQLAVSRAEANAASRDLEAATTNPVPIQTPDAPGVNPSRFAELAASSAAELVQQKRDLTLIALKRRLNLSPDQEARLAAFLKAGEERQMLLTRELLSGNKPSAERMSELAKSGKLQSESDFLKEILSPDQFADYKSYKAEETSELYASLAQHDLNAISAMVKMDDDQKDVVYGILFEAHEFKPKVTGVPPDQIWAERQKQKAEFLRERLADVLTPEEIAPWFEQEKRKQESQQALIKQFTPSLPGNATFEEP